MGKVWFQSISPVIRLAIHLGPLWPLYERRWALLGAAILLLLVPYIKVKKMGGDSTDFSTWPSDKIAAYKRWQLLTFRSKA